MSHTYRINPETHEEEVERRYLKRKKKIEYDNRVERRKTLDQEFLEVEEDDDSN
jgi:hypothetical protein